MKIKSANVTVTVTKTFSVKIVYKGQAFPLWITVVDNKFPDYKAVASTNGSYFSIPEKTRKTHYNRIKKFLQS